MTNPGFEPVDLWDLECKAREILDPGVYDFFAGGAGEELTLADNVAAWNRLRLRPRVLRDVSRIDTSTTMLGAPVVSPLAVAPMAFQRLADPDGELAAARGATAAGNVMVVATGATVRLEDVAAAVPHGQCWFQLYVLRDRDLTADIVRRAAAAGYHALVLTVDTPVVGVRRRDQRNRFRLPDQIIAENVTPMPVTQADKRRPSLDHDPNVTSKDIAWLVEVSGLPVVCKGVLSSDDARLCVAAGAAAVIVSNHGGRQLDTVLSSADALPGIVQAVGDTAEVYVDGGIRNGSSVLKALALGAQGVFVGRPIIWGLVTGGASGVQTVLDSLRQELATAMTLCGASSVKMLTPDLIAGTGPSIS